MLIIPIITEGANWGVIFLFLVWSLCLFSVVIWIKFLSRLIVNSSLASLSFLYHCSVNSVALKKSVNWFNVQFLMIKPIPSIANSGFGSTAVSPSWGIMVSLLFENLYSVCVSSISMAEMNSNSRLLPGISSAPLTITPRPFSLATRVEKQRLGILP